MGYKYNLQMYNRLESVLNERLENSPISEETDLVEEARKINQNKWRNKS